MPLHQGREVRLEVGEARGVGRLRRRRKGERCDEEEGETSRYNFGRLEMGSRTSTVPMQCRGMRESNFPIAHAEMAHLPNHSSRWLICH